MIKKLAGLGMLMIVLFGSGCAFKAGNEDRTGNTTIAKQPIPLVEAERKIHEYYGSHSSEISPAVPGPLKITEMPSEEVWEKMQAQLYSVECNQGVIFFIIDHGSTVCLKGCFDPTLRYVVSDLDRNGMYELIYTYQFGSGVSTGVLGAYTEGRIIGIGTELTKKNYGLMYSYQFEKSNDQDVAFQVVSNGAAFVGTSEANEAGGAAAAVELKQEDQSLDSGRFVLKRDEKGHLILDARK